MTVSTRPTCALADPAIPRRLRCAIHGKHLDGCTCADQGHEHGRTVRLDAAVPADLPTWELELLADADGAVLAHCSNCDGCLPRQAADDSATCGPCEQRARGAARDLPDLYADLAERPRVAGLSSAPAGNIADQDAPEARVPLAVAPVAAPIGDASVATRSDIRIHLARWVAVLAADHGRTAPDHDRIVQTTHDIAAYHSGLAARAGDLATILATPALAAPVGVHPDPSGAAHARAEAHRHRGVAAAARDDRETGRDVVRALAQHIDRHLDALLADPDTARAVVADLCGLRRDARRTANRSRDTRQRIACSCGAHVTLDATERMTCPGCGAWGVLAWWVEQQAAQPAEAMTTYDLVGWLLIHGIDLAARVKDPSNTIRQWAVRFPEHVQRVGSDRRGRALYAAAGVLAVAQRQARPPVPRPREAPEQ